MTAIEKDTIEIELNQKGNPIAFKGRTTAGNWKRHMEHLKEALGAEK